MNGFANGLFSVLLGWLRGLTEQIWALLSGDGGSFLAWVGRNWIVLLILLCVIGSVADLIIYLIRWRPWRVWQSFFQRIRPGSGESVPQQQWLYADGTSRAADQPYVPVFNQNTEEATPAASEEELAKLSFQQLPPSQNSNESPVRDILINEAESDSYRGLRGALRGFLGQDDSPDDYRYQAEKPPVDFSYREPYIPPQWKKPDDTGNQEDAG